MALSPHRAFDPLLHRAARLTSIITTIEAEVASAFSMPILSVLDDLMPLEITGGLLSGRCEAARSFKAASEAAVRRSSAAARTGRLRRTARASPELAAFEACVKASHERLDEALKKSGACQ